jgi:hypothetical protein
MSDPRVKRGEPEPWAGKSPQYGALEYWTPVQVYRITLRCPDCRRADLVTTGQAHEQGTVHACGGCGAKHVVPGPAYPRREERVDLTVQPLKGTMFDAA